MPLERKVLPARIEVGEVEIRPASISDCEAMAAIYAQSQAAHDSTMEMNTNAATFEARLDGLHPREALVVVEDGGLVGWGIVKRYSDRVGYRVACETSIYLDRSRRGRGYGKALQARLMEICRELGYHHVVAKIWASNQASIAFHERFGFEMVGVQKEIGYIAGRWRDVAILQCLLRDVAPYEPELA